MKFENYGVFQNFANEIGKLWGFHLEKPHNFQFHLQNGKLWGFWKIFQMPLFARYEPHPWYNPGSVFYQIRFDSGIDSCF